MASPIAVLVLELGSDRVDLAVQKIDLVRFEQLTSKSVGKLESDPALSDLFALAFVAARRLKVAGVPESFDEFLDACPDVEQKDAPDAGEDAGGKGSGLVAPIG